MAEFRPSHGSSALARAVSRPRSLHFDGPDKWMDYNDRYGKGGLFKTVIHQLDFAGKNSALMKRWGPSPEVGFAFQQKRLTALADAAGDTIDVKRINSARVKAAFESVNGRGDAPGSLRLAQTMKTLRTIEVLGKLGGIVLSKVSDLPIAGFTMARAGGRFFDGVKGDLTGLFRLGGEDFKQAAEALDVGYRQMMAEFAGQYYSTDGMAGLGSYLGGMMMKVNAFDGLNNSFKRGFAGIYSRFLAQEAEHDWDGLQIGTRENFERFGIDADDWEAVRHGLEPLEDGKTYFTLDHTEALAREAAAGLDPVAAAAADERHWKFAALVHNTLDNTVSHPRAREHVSLTQGFKPGTRLGEIFRALTQFKGFVTTILGRQFVPMLSGYAGRSPPALLMQFFVFGTAAGYASMSLKALARGELPHDPFGPDIKDDVKTWLGAFAQFGGLGIYGDFLFGEQNRAGQDFGLGALMGPMASDAELIAKVVAQAVHGGAISETTGRSQIPAELLRLGSGVTPFANVFYARLAFDYFVLWRLLEALSPGYLQRHEQRVQEKEGGTFYVHPTSAVQ
jgi:hypothetical protein